MYKTVIKNKEKFQNDTKETNQNANPGISRW